MELKLLLVVSETFYIIHILGFTRHTTYIVIPCVVSESMKKNMGVISSVFYVNYNSRTIFVGGHEEKKTYKREREEKKMCVRLRSCIEWRQREKP